MTANDHARRTRAAVPALAAAVLAVSFGARGAAGAEDTVTITDDTATFAVDVPVSWGDVSTTPLEFSDGTFTPSLCASTDFIAFPDGTVEGMTMLSNPGPLNPGPIDPGFLDALVLPGCTASAPPVETALPALARALVGTYACGEFVEVVAYGETADQAWSVGIDARVKGDPARGRAIIDSLRYLRTDGTGSAPPTTLAVETEGLTIVNAGDPATAVELRRRRPVGERSTLTIDSATQAHETITDDQFGTTSEVGFTSRLQAAGPTEVLTSDRDGIYQQRFTPATVSAQYESVDPADAVQVDGAQSLVGLPMTLWYESNGLPIGFVAEDHASEVQQDWIGALPSDGYGLPLAPVGVGAEWTADVEIVVGWVFTTVPATYRLESVDGDRSVVTMSLTVDVSTLEPDELTTAMAGTFTRTMRLDGSLTTPQSTLTVEESADMTGSFTYGASSHYQWSSTRTYTEVPLA